MSANPVSTQTTDTRIKPLRIWFPVCVLPLMIAARFVPDVWADGPSWSWAVSAFLPFLLSLLLILWWLSFSRARYYERLLGLLAIVIVLVLQQVISHETMRGPLFIVMTIPMTVAAFCIGLIFLGRWLTPRRTAYAVVLSALAASVSMFFRNDGAWGDFSFELKPRWSEDESRTVASAQDASVSSSIPADAPLVSTWPRFRGPLQDGAVRGGPQLDADWEAHPPKELWRRQVGPAWSSFVSVDDFLFTQEQRDEDEAVVCYDAHSGNQVWICRWPTKFYEALGGLGPRATPTYADGFLYALGAEGKLVKLNVRNGEIIWEADVKQAADRKEAPMWGFSASPLVVNNLVVVHAGGERDKGILAFQAADGQLAWTAQAGIQSYGSVQAATILGTEYLALLSDTGAELWSLDGKKVLDYSWPHKGYRAVQPQIIDGDKLLIATGMGTGTRLVQLSMQDGRLDAEELWTSRDLKPDFNDVMVHKGYVYGFDNRIFTCLDLKTGKRKWKGGHYEKGQALLVADSDLIIVVGEKGQLVLLRANPEKHEELANIKSMNDKTWNHPILVGDRLYLRSATEAVAYQLQCAASER